MNPAELVSQIPVPIRATGWSVTGVGVWVMIGMLAPILIAVIRLWPALRKLRNESDGSLRSDLLKQVNSLRAEVQQERVDCSRRLNAMQNKMDAVTRQFVQFQITMVRLLPPEHSLTAQDVANRLLDIIATDVEEFGPHETHEVHEPERLSSD